MRQRRLRSKASTVPAQLDKSRRDVIARPSYAAERVDATADHGATLRAQAGAGATASLASDRAHGSSLGRWLAALTACASPPLLPAGLRASAPNVVSAMQFRQQPNS
jgi:hypothetical protein